MTESLDPIVNGLQSALKTLAATPAGGDYRTKQGRLVRWMVAN